MVYQVEKWYLQLILLLSVLMIFVQIINLGIKISLFNSILLVVHVSNILIINFAKNEILKIGVLVWILLFFLPGFVGILSILGLMLFGNFEFINNLYTTLDRLFHFVFGLILIINWNKCIVSS